MRQPCPVSVSETCLLISEGFEGCPLDDNECELEALVKTEE